MNYLLLLEDSLFISVTFIVLMLSVVRNCNCDDGGNAVTEKTAITKLLVLIMVMHVNNWII